MCVNCASTDLWGAWVGDHPGLPGGYYLADEIAAEYRTLAKYLPAEKWKGWRELGAKEMASLLTEIARQVNVAELLRNQRGPKKPPDKKPVYNRKHKHFSTYRLME